MKVLVIDNYDSFVYNLVQYIGELGGDPIVYRNNKVTMQKLIELKPDRIVISPGPGTPEDERYFGVCTRILQTMSQTTPAYGGKVIHAKRLMHGKTCTIKHDKKGIFTGVRNPFTGIRYHSLAGERNSLPQCLEISAECIEDGEIMAVRHAKYPIEGVQFHPESIICDDGKLIIKNFLEGRRR